MALTRRRKIFIAEYLATWNAAEAARRAGYSARSARSLGSEILTFPDIKAEIARQVAERAMTGPEALDRLAQQARGDVGEFFAVRERWTLRPLDADDIVRERAVVDAQGKPLVDEQGRPMVEYLVRRVALDVRRLKDPAFSRAVRKFADSPRGGMSIELHDAQSALQALGKALGVLRDNVMVQHEGPLQVVTRIVRKMGDNDAGS